MTVEIAQVDVYMNVVIGNEASRIGGGLAFYGMHPKVVRNNVVAFNSATNALAFGGGISLNNTSCDLVRNTLYGNFAARGGGIGTSRNCELTIADNIIATSGGESGVWVGHEANRVQFFRNNLFNNGQSNYASVEPATLTDQTGTNGNISLDPLLADPENGDFHLMSEAGRWVDGAGWTQDDVTSPCIDAGDPEGDYAKEPTPNGGRVNMGAYGNTEEASKSVQ